MSTLNFTVKGFLAPCAHCKVPLVSPLPTDWTLTISPDPVGLPNARRTLITPHTPDCDRPQS